jgi:RNA polymerase sigma-70 factor (ECF subfamily)
MLDDVPRTREASDVRTLFDSGWRRRALDGDSTAIGVLADEALTPLYQFCLYRVGRDPHLCEEVVQETLVRALGDLSHYDPRRCGDNIFPWLTGLARNEIRRVLAREKHGTSLDLLWARVDRELAAVYERIEAEPFDDAVLQREETRELVNVTMSQIPPHYREALEAKYVKGHSVRDLATLWRQTEKAVESLLTRARKAFRATFLALNKTLETNPV